MNVPGIDIFGGSAGATRPGFPVNGFSTYPGGIGSANRVLSVGGWFSDTFGDALRDVVKVGTDVLGNVASQLLESSVVKLKRQMGYKDLGVVTVDGRPVVKMLDPQGRPIYVGPNGQDIPVTLASQQNEVHVDSGGRYMAAGAIGLGVVAAGLLIVLLMRRR